MRDIGHNTRRWVTDHQNTSTYIISIGLLCWGRRWRSVPSWGDASCSGSEKSSSSTHWPSGGKDSSGSRRPSRYPDSHWPGCDSSPSPASKRVKLAILVVFSSIPLCAGIYTSQKSVSRNSVKRNKETTCQVKTKSK